MTERTQVSRKFFFPFLGEILVIAHYSAYGMSGYQPSAIPPSLHFPFSPPLGSHKRIVNEKKQQFLNGFAQFHAVPWSMEGVIFQVVLGGSSYPSFVVPYIVLPGELSFMLSLVILKGFSLGSYMGKPYFTPCFQENVAIFVLKLSFCKASKKSAFYLT